MEIIKTILYYDVFDYPLTVSELYAHHGKNYTEVDFNSIISELTNENFLLKKEGFLFSSLASASNIEKRRDGNKMAIETMPTAIHWSKKINQFPFVRSVNISGSLSKNYYDKHSDIDYFIITKANRLWICRTMLILYWKILSPENKKKCCTNYFIDETVLEINDKNRFTATELSYLLPTINSDITQKLVSNNQWIKSYIDNKIVNKNFEIKEKDGFLKRIIESLLNNKFGNLIDNILLKQTIKQWRKKYPEMADEDFELQFRSRKNVCKRHTKGFQNKVLQKWQEKKKEYEAQFHISL